jgi:predicted Fe-Mo cluster-binding NifX family protein
VIDLGKGENMIVALPYLQGEVNQHFGSTQAFLVAYTAGEEVERTKIFEMKDLQHDHAGIVGFLKEQAVEVVLAGGMGPPMQQALTAAGFDVWCGVSGPALEVVNAFVRGEVERSDATCGHHHGGHPQT